MAIFSGDIFAEQYVISSSVTIKEISSASGSTSFGDSSDDTHQFTGSIKSTGAIITDNLVRVDVLDGLWFNGGGSSTFSPSPYIGYTSSPTGTGWFWQLPNNGTEKFSYKLGATEASRQFRIVGPNWESSAIITGDGRLALGADKFELTDNPSSQLHISGSDSLSLVRVENSGDKLFEIIGSQISGSSSSTGSFGSLVVADAIQGSTTIKGGDFIPRGRLTTSTNSVIIGSSAYKLGTAGDRNVVIGESAAGFNSMDGSVDDSVLIGYRAGANVTSNFYNVAIGSNALYSNKTGNSNIAIGYGALYTEGSRGSNVAIGYNALNKQSGSSGISADNVAIGYAAAEDATTATRMVIIGTNAGRDITTGGSHTMVGWRAGFTNTTGTSNTFIGNYSGYTNLSGYSNTAVGGSSFYYNSTGYESVAVGLNAGYMFGRGGHSAHSSVFVGNNSGYYATGSRNTFVGKDAGKGGTTSSPYSSGYNNTALGYQALISFTTATNNVAVGYQAGYSSDSNGGNVFIGYTAGYEADSATTSAINNVYIGQSAGQFLDDGTNNVAIGMNAMSSNSDGAANAVNSAIAIGRNAMASSVSNQGTIVIGYYAGDHASADVDNAVIIGREAARGAMTSGADGTVAIGYQAGTRHTSGAGCVYVGNAAGDHCTDGNRNVAIGEASLSGNADDDNVAVGYGALGTCLGADNVGVGTNAGNTINSGTENTLVGYNVDVASEDNTNNIVLGNNLTATDKDNAVFIGNDTNHIENDFNADATWNYSSDVRQKKEIEDDTLGLDFINKIRPVVYKHKSPSEFPKEWSSYDENDKEPMGGDKKIHGLIAQEVKEALEDVNIDSFGGWSEGDDGRQRVSREMFVTPLIKAVQELTEIVKSQQKEIEELKKK